jgi:tctex1 domain-containing protein 2
MTTEPIKRLNYTEKVTATQLKSILKDSLSECASWTYDGEKCGEATKTLSDSIRDKLKSLGKDRYKFMVHVVIGESREQGVRSGTRCFWDASTDQHASETCVNDSLFVCATAWAVYLY